MSMRRLLLSLTLSVALAVPAAWADKQKVKEQETQTLELPPDPPAVVTAETDRLVFHVTPLSAKGLLSQQVRDALKWLLRQKATVVRLRAFVAGTGDMRRVQAIVSEVFSDKKLPLPALSVVQVGALPLDGAQVVLESMAMSRNPVNPHGLAFISGQGASVEKPLQPLAPLFDQSVERMRAALQAAGLKPADVLCVTCYLSSLDELTAIRQRAHAEFPKAALNFVQRTREPLQSLVECEAVARLRRRPAQPLVFVNPPELAGPSDTSQIALVGGRRLALTGTQLAFGFDDDDARLAFQRLGRSLAQKGASYDHVAVTRIYPLSSSIAELVRKIRPEFCGRERPPAGTMVAFQGLPSLDASFALDVIAVLPDTL
ncbi:MAG TPA: RidA family protein [Bryobacteraceae bacterium]|nr:RidA family protein [Bryobacteraceae bacterium]